MKECPQKSRVTPTLAYPSVTQFFLHGSFMCSPPSQQVRSCREDNWLNLMGVRHADRYLSTWSLSIKNMRRSCSTAPVALFKPTPTILVDLQGTSLRPRALWRLSAYAWRYGARWLQESVLQEMATTKFWATTVWFLIAGSEREDLAIYGFIEAIMVSAGASAASCDSVLWLFNCDSHADPRTTQTGSHLWCNNRTAEGMMWSLSQCETAQNKIECIVLLLYLLGILYFRTMIVPMSRENDQSRDR